MFVPTIFIMAHNITTTLFPLMITRHYVLWFFIWLLFHDECFSQKMWNEEKIDWNWFLFDFDLINYFILFYFILFFSKSRPQKSKVVTYWKEIRGKGFWKEKIKNWLIKFVTMNSNCWHALLTKRLSTNLIHFLPVCCFIRAWTEGKILEQLSPRTKGAPKATHCFLLS